MSIRAVENDGGRQVGTDVLKRRDCQWVFGKTFGEAFEAGDIDDGVEEYHGVGLGRYRHIFIGRVLAGNSTGTRADVTASRSAPRGDAVGVDIEFIGVRPQPADC